MSEKQPTQKQIAGKYAGNPGYFGKPHYLRRLRGWIFVGVAAASVAAVLGFRFWGRDEMLSKGPLSEKHSQLTEGCHICHVGAQTDVFGLRFSDKAGRPSTPEQFVAAMAHQRAGGEPHPSPGAEVFPTAERPAMDQACLKCHPGFGLHLPQLTTLAAQPLGNEMTIVHATRCYECHREHVGRGRMAVPDRATCAACHGETAALLRALVAVPARGKTVAASGENGDLGDGLLRFITPARSPGSLGGFVDFARGHPPFAYEKPGVRDPADLKFNHARHARADVVAMGPGRKLDCTACHEAGAGGVFYQPVNYERHCQQCHTLQISPELPSVRIPHGDPEKVRYFLASVNVAIERALRAGGLTARDEIQRRTEEEMGALRRRGLTTLDELEKRVFFEGDPSSTGGQRRMRSGDSKFLTECAKCHTVSPGDPTSVPAVRPPNIARRWIQRGPFTHLPHQHMTCAECHGAAATSKLTSDILLPSQKSCAECHRPQGAIAAASGAKGRGDFNGDGRAAWQRMHGGIKWDCQSCHGFHAPPGAETKARALHAAGG